MELNLNQALKNLDGTEIVGNPKKGEEVGEVFTLKMACANALLGMYKGEENLSGDKKAKRCHLAMKIYDSKGIIDLPIDDIKLLKDLIGKNPSSLIVGQAYDILDPPKQEVKKTTVKDRKGKK